MVTVFSIDFFLKGERKTEYLKIIYLLRKNDEKCKFMNTRYILLKLRIK